MDLDFSGLLDIGGLFGGHSANQKMIEASNADRNLQRTMYQVRVADLAKAGLNPMMAYGNMGGMHGGGIPSLSNPAQHAGAFSVARAQKEMLAADVDLKRAQAEGIRATIPKTGAETQHVKALVDNVLADTKLKHASAFQVSAARDKLYAEVEEIQAKITNLVADTALKGEQVWSEQASQIASQASAFLHRVSGLEKQGMLKALWEMATNEAYRSKLSLPHAENMSNAEFSTWKKVFAPFISDMSSIAQASGAAWFLQRIAGGR